MHVDVSWRTTALTLSDVKKGFDTITEAPGGGQFFLVLSKRWRRPPFQSSVIFKRERCSRKGLVSENHFAELMSSTTRSQVASNSFTHSSTYSWYCSVVQEARSADILVTHIPKLEAGPFSNALAQAWKAIQIVVSTIETVD